MEALKASLGKGKGRATALADAADSETAERKAGRAVRGKGRAQKESAKH